MTETTPQPKPKRARPARPVPAPVEPDHWHPNLGRPPVDLQAGFPAAADVLRASRSEIAAAALTAVADSDFRSRLGEVRLRLLLADTEVMVERLAMAVGADDPRLMAEYAEWAGPVLRRRRQSLWDMAAVCAAARDVVRPRLDEPAAVAAIRALDAAVEVLRKNGRLGGDGHRRNALLKWLYRGV